MVSAEKVFYAMSGLFILAGISVTEVVGANIDEQQKLMPFPDKRECRQMLDGKILDRRKQAYDASDFHTYHVWTENLMALRDSTQTVSKDTYATNLKITRDNEVLLPMFSNRPGCVRFARKILSGFRSDAPQPKI